MTKHLFDRRLPFTACLWALVALLLASTVRAQDDPPGRVGRVAELQGGVLWFDHEQGQWVQAQRNRVVTTGDRLSTAPEGRVELRVGSTVLRLGGATELEVLRLDDERMGFQLHSGNLALRVRSREMAAEIDIVTAEVRLQPQRSGHYRIDRVDDTTQAGSWRGDLVVEGAAGLVIATGQRAELWRHGPRGELRQRWISPLDDDFSRWVSRDDHRDERTASTRFVSPEMTGAEDLDLAGRWDRHPEHGAIWFPIEVRPGWAPYRYGRWAWVRPWGWTWVDEAPWGFAPFHYGRWLSWNGRWGWVPGSFVARPVFAPALVAWVGGSSWNVSVHGPGGAVGWVPLAPREVFVPHYRHTPRHRDRINHLHAGGHGPQRPPHWPHERPGSHGWSNQAVPGAVTVVPRDALEGRRAIGREAAEWRDRQRGVDSAGLVAAPPPNGPQAVTVLPQGQPFGPPRPRTEMPTVAEPQRERGDRIERTDRADRAERLDRIERVERTERTERAAGLASPGIPPAWRGAPDSPLMGPPRGGPGAPAAVPRLPLQQQGPPPPMPQAQPAPHVPPPSIGPARPSAPAAVPPPAPAAPAAVVAPPRPQLGSRERALDSEAAGGQGDHRRGNSTARQPESQR